VKFRLASLPGLDNPTTAVQENGTHGDEGKAVGCVPPTALLLCEVHELNPSQAFLVWRRDKRPP